MLPVIRRHSFGFFLQRARPPQHLALQEKGHVSFGLWLWNSWGGIALIMFLLLMKAVPSGVVVSTLDNTETTTSGGEGVPVLDKLPPNCRYVEVVSFGLWLWNPWGGIALIVFLLMMKAVASGAAVPTLNNTETTSSGGEGVPVVDKLLPYCRYVDN